MNRDITPMDVEFMGGCFDAELLQDAPIIIPNKLSQLTNDVGFITLADIPPIPTQISELTNDVGYITINDIPPIPNKTSDLINDSGYITIADVPTKTSELTNDSGFITSPNVVYCTCSTARGTTTKVATIVSGTLTTLNVGDQAIVKFTNSNTSASPTLKIGDTDAKSIMRYGTTIPSASAETSWNAGSPILFVYDGTYWVMCGFLNSVYYEISEANITNATSSTTGLVTGRRAKSAVEEFAPVKDVQINGTSVVSGGVATIPPLVIDLGVIDGEEYDWEVEEYLNTLTESGSYKFQWDEFKYWVDIETLEVDGTTTVQQIYWDTEEGGTTIYYRNLTVEDGEIVSADTTNFVTFDEVNSVFARNTHTHVRFDAKSQSIWDYCNTVAMSNTNPFVIYFDLSTNKTYLIETFVGNRQPVYKIQKFTEMNDASYFCQRSSYYYSGQEHWGDWYKFSGTVFTP